MADFSEELKAECLHIMQQKWAEATERVRQLERIADKDKEHVYHKQAYQLAQKQEQKYRRLVDELSPTQVLIKKKG